MEAEACESQGFRWQVPTRPTYVVDKHQLKLLNSYTKKKELFVTNKTKTIKWYSCGPTVYDVAHLGHARCYMTFDIVRRILADYFGYHVHYVMNITDIDDKIIKRARSNHLCDKFIVEESSKFSQNELADYLKEALSLYQTKRKDEKDPAKLDMINKTVSSSTQAIENIEKLAVDEYKSTYVNALNGTRDIIAEHQDDKLGHTVADHEIFKHLTIKYEQEFHADMEKLNVLRPSALTRVSEFIKEIGAFIRKLESNGYAYRSGGSVYFDTLKFDGDAKHSYAKLVREAFGHNKKTPDEGEGELSLVGQDTKRAPSDFALWKKSKSGEPSWTTEDFEPGRPGWHIECSVMASLMLGENFDLHSGGCDLKFPHHDNEIAQAEAYYDTGRNWVNYFVHSGHLTISGCKMSKSLKNFITIRQALNEYTARQLRFAFLAHSWAETLDYSPNTMKTAVTYEKTFKEFFLNIADYSRRLLSDQTSSSGDTANGASCDIYRKWTKDDHELNDKFLHAVDKVDIALCDNLNTRSALNALTALIKECNKRPNVDLVLVRDITNYIMRILAIFGAGFDEIKFKPLYRDPEDVKASEDPTEISLKFVDALACFRAEVRKISKSSLSGDAQQGIKQILTLCDTVRDKTLPSLGVKLEDKEVQGVPYVVKLIDPK